MKISPLYVYVALSLIALPAVVVSMAGSANEPRRFARADHNHKQAQRACREFAKTAKQDETKIVAGKPDGVHDICRATADGAILTKMRALENDRSVIASAGTYVIE